MESTSRIAKPGKKRTPFGLALTLLTCFSLLAGGCSPAQAQPPTSEVAAVTATNIGPNATVQSTLKAESGKTPAMPTPSASATITATATAAANATASASPAACLQDSGHIDIHSLQSPHLKEPQEVYVYTPPCYEQMTDRYYPVLYFFHGANNTLEQWDRLELGRVADDLIRSAEIAPLLIVMPQESLFLRPSRTGFDEAFLETVLPWAEENYRIQGRREQRAVGGLSRGGAWAVHFGINYWQQFGALGAHSAAAFLEDAKLLEGWLDNIAVEDLPRIYMDIGDLDELQESNTWLEDTLNAHNIPHEYYVFPGYHDENYWSAHLDDYLRWYSAVW